MDVALQESFDSNTRTTVVIRNPSEASAGRIYRPWPRLFHLQYRPILTSDSPQSRKWHDHALRPVGVRGDLIGREQDQQPLSRDRPLTEVARRRSHAVREDICGKAPILARIRVFSRAQVLCTVICDRLEVI